MLAVLNSPHQSNEIKQLITVLFRIKFYEWYSYRLRVRRAGWNLAQSTKKQVWWKARDGLPKRCWIQETITRGLLRKFTKRFDMGNFDEMSKSIILVNWRKLLNFGDNDQRLFIFLATNCVTQFEMLGIIWVWMPDIRNFNFTSVHSFCHKNFVIFFTEFFFLFYI